MALERFAVKVAGIVVPGNWDRPLGYDGHARHVAAYWDFVSNDVFVTDGLAGQSGGAWWLYTNLVDHDARHEIIAALQACGADQKCDGALGDSDIEATYCLILDRFEHSIWVSRLNDAMPFLSQQHKEPNRKAITYALSKQKTELFEAATVRPSLPCHCARGWVLSGNYYVPCSECQQSGRIEVIPKEVIL